MWDRLMSTMRSLLRRRAFETELDEELQDHLDRDVAHRVASGMSPAEARRLALADLGGVGRVKDDVREAHASEASPRNAATVGPNLTRMLPRQSPSD